MIIFTIMDDIEISEIARKYAGKMGFNDVKVIGISVPNSINMSTEVIVRADGGMYGLFVYDSGKADGWHPIEH